MQANNRSNYSNYLRDSSVSPRNFFTWRFGKAYVGLRAAGPLTNMILKPKGWHCRGPDGFDASLGGMLQAWLGRLMSASWEEALQNEVGRMEANHRLLE